MSYMPECNSAVSDGIKGFTALTCLFERMCTLDAILHSSVMKSKVFVYIALVRVVLQSSEAG